MHELVVAIIICLFIGGMIGFYIGVDYTVKRVVEVAKPFVSIDKLLVEQALFQYNNQIGNCYNALIRSDERDEMGC